MSCCAAPEPRILEKNGRTFCVNCRRYLDAPSIDDDPPQVEADDVPEPPKEKTQ